MKEASGELSMTAIAVVAIGAIAVLFGTFIFPNIKSSLEMQQLCSAAFGCDCGTNEKTCKCQAYKGTSTTPTEVFCDNANN